MFSVFVVCRLSELSQDELDRRVVRILGSFQLVESLVSGVAAWSEPEEVSESK